MTAVHNTANLSTSGEFLQATKALSEAHVCSILMLVVIICNVCLQCVRMKKTHFDPLLIF